MTALRSLALLAFVGLGGIAATSCRSCDDQAAEMVLCDCGYEKGSEHCCDPNATRCPDCGKIQGSPGCCCK
ncbi:MAG: hypothetical protein AB1726_05345 [Planctomycetota bacterium]